MSYLREVERARGYIAATRDESVHASREADDWNRKAARILEARAKLAGETWPSPTGTLTYTLIPESLQSSGKIARLLFPPAPQTRIPLGLPPPPPPLAHPGEASQKDL